MLNLMSMAKYITCLQLHNTNKVLQLLKEVALFCCSTGQMVIVWQHPLENEHNVFKTVCSPCEKSLNCFFFFFFSAIDYIHFLHKEKKKQEEEVSVLRKEVMALKIMKTWDGFLQTLSAKMPFYVFYFSFHVLANSNLVTWGQTLWRSCICIPKS